MKNLTQAQKSIIDQKMIQLSELIKLYEEQNSTDVKINLNYGKVVEIMEMMKSVIGATPFSSDYPKNAAKKFASNNLKPLSFYSPSRNLEQLYLKAAKGLSSEVLAQYTSDTDKAYLLRAKALIDGFENEQKYRQAILPYRMLAFHILSIRKFEKKSLIKKMIFG